MPRYSQARKTHLLSIDEAAKVFGVSTKTIRRDLKKMQKIFRDFVKKSHESGAKVVIYLDPNDLMAYAGRTPVQSARVQSEVSDWTRADWTNENRMDNQAERLCRKANTAKPLLMSLRG